MNLLNQVQQLFDQLHPSAQWLLRSSWQAGVLAILILILQFTIGRRLTARWRYNLWLLVLIRLLLPVVPPSPISIHNLLTRAEAPATPVPTPDSAGALQVETLGVVFPDSPPIELAAPSPKPIPPPPPARSWLIPTLAILYLTILLLLLSRILFATIKLSLQSRRFKPITNPAVIDLLNEAKKHLHIRRNIALLEASDLSTPALMGLLRPRILLPTHILENFEPAELRLILLHELAHFRRHDIAVNWLATLLQSLHWFNPLIALAFSRLRAERELACDELVLDASEQPQRRQYGNTMIKLLQAFSPGKALPGAVGILEGKAPLRRRITMIAQFKSRRHLSALPILIIALLAMICLTDSAVGQQGQTQPQRGGGGGDRGGNAVPAGHGHGHGGGGFAGGAAPAQARLSSDDDSSNEAATAATRAILRRKLPEIKFQELPLAEAIAFIQDVTGLNIYTDWRAIEGHLGAGRDLQITLKLKDVPASEVLRLVLREAAPELRYEVQSGIVIISPNPSQPVAIIKAYAVDDLTRDIRHFKKYQKTLEENLQSATDPDHKAKYRQELEQLEQNIDQQASQRLNELVQLIETTVAPFAPSGLAVKSFGGKLIVTADEAGHQEVAKVLQMLGHKPDRDQAIDPVDGKASKPVENKTTAPKTGSN
jgi:beta-lactamase regulating signal transducer with metallopeptidase domain